MFKKLRYGLLLAITMFLFPMSEHAFAHHRYKHYKPYRYVRYYHVRPAPRYYVARYRRPVVVRYRRPVVVRKFYRPATIVRPGAVIYLSPRPFALFRP